MSESNPTIFVVLGTTASGKGALARALATKVGGEILSIDSMKVYRHMDIGTAKPSREQRTAIRHHLIDVAEPSESYSAARYVEAADHAVAEIHARGRPIIAVGGTMLYFKCYYEGLFVGPDADPAFRANVRQRIEREGADAVHAELARIDPAAAERIHRNDTRRIERALEIHHFTGKPISELQSQWDDGALRRPDWHWTLIGVRRERDDNNRRINERVRRMIEAGLVDEVRALASEPRGISKQARQAVGYRELFEHFETGSSLDEAIEKIKINTRRLAKQQRTWLKRFADVRWIEASPQDDAAALLDRAVALVRKTS